MGIIMSMVIPSLAAAQPADLPGISNPLYLTPIADPTAIPKFVNSLPVMKLAGLRVDAVASPNFSLKAAPCQQDMLGDGHLTNLLGFALDGGPVTHPGPTVVAKKNTPVTVTWINDLGFTYPLQIDTSILWAYSLAPYNTRTIENNGVPFVPYLAGGHSNTEVNGLPDQWWTPLYHTTLNPLARGSDFTSNIYIYDNSQEAATLWYHDRSLGITRLQSYLGMAGFYFVRDDNELGLIAANSIPNGDYEIELAVQDKTFWPNGQLAIPNVPSVPGLRADQTIQPEMFGNVICVNGKAWPSLDVERRQYRFRIVNASDSRFYRAWLDTGGVAISFKQIGSDDGFLPAPVVRDTMLMGCGERYDIVIDFSNAKFSGKTITLRNNAPAPFPAGTPVDANTGVIMQFHVGTAPVVDPVHLPATLRPAIAALVPNGPTRQLILTQVLDQYGRTTSMLGTTAGGKKAFTDPTTESIKLNNIELWEIYNTTSECQPMHLDLVYFQIVSRQDFTCTQNPTTRAISNIVLGSTHAIPPEQQGWKDTEIMYPHEVTRIRAKFDKSGTYLWNCAMLSHEENEMMRKFYVRHVLVGPQLTYPTDFATGIDRSAEFSWTAVLDAATYTIQICEDNKFTNKIVVNQSGIDTTTFTPAAPLSQNKLYYWRVRADNVDGAGPWSAVNTFTTAQSTTPTHFVFNGGGPLHKHVTIPSANAPTIDGTHIVDGDEIGVFNAASVCVGAVVWHASTITFNVWGDNLNTPEIDGMLPGDTLYYRLWKESNDIEYIGATPTYSNGNGIWTSNANATLSSLSALTYPPASQLYIIPPGWNLRSTYIRLANTAIVNVCAPLMPNLVIVKNGRGQVYWPGFVNDITTWNNGEGYQVYMEHGDTAVFIGSIERPETKPLSLSAGWNMVGYLRYSSLDPIAAFSTISTELLLVKNNYGDVYWPEYGINTISTLDPGEGYQLYLSAPSILTYPPNDVLPPGTAVPYVLKVGTPSVHHYAPSFTTTGSSATLLLRFKDAVHDLDEVVARNAQGLCIGTGLIKDQQAIVTLWGDNTITRITDGAIEGERLTLAQWSPETKIEKQLSVIKMTDGINGGTLDASVTYRTNAVSIAEVVQGAQAETFASVTGAIPTEFSLGQNYPNPFNPETRIAYGLPKDARVVLDVFDILGQKVVRLVDGMKPAGYHEAAFNASQLSSGLYVYRLTAGDFIQVKKMMLVR
jgi:spore coat protein A, manganese oxidase